MFLCSTPKDPASISDKGFNETAGRASISALVEALLSTTKAGSTLIIGGETVVLGAPKRPAARGQDLHLVCHAVRDPIP